MSANGVATPSALELLSWVQEERADFVNVQFTDITDVLNGVPIPPSELDDAFIDWPSHQAQHPPQGTRLIVPR